jgi:hypothetical protein
VLDEDEVVPVPVADELLGAVEELPGVPIVDGDELGLLEPELVEPGLVELGLVGLGLVDPAVVDPLCVAGVPAVVTHGAPPGVLGVVGWLPAGVPGAAGFDGDAPGVCMVLGCVLCGVV